MPFFCYSSVMGFAENVKSELEFQDIQVKELSARTGISRNTLDKYLFGKKVQPGVENAFKIAVALGVSLEYLLLGTSTPESESLFLKPEFRNLVDQYRKLNDFNRKTVDDVLQSLLSRQTSQYRDYVTFS